MGAALAAFVAPKAAPTFNYVVQVILSSILLLLPASSAAIGDAVASCAHGRFIFGGVKSYGTICVCCSTYQVGIAVAGRCGGGNLYIVAEELIASDSRVIG